MGQGHYDDSTVTEIPAGTAPGASLPTSDAITAPSGNDPWGLAFDAAGNIWAGGYDSLFTIPANTTSETTLPATDNITGDGIGALYFSVVDPAGNVWGSNEGNSTITEWVGLGQ